MKEWDVFISHASEDKDAVAIPLYDLLSEAGLRVWFDNFELTLGDSLHQKIEEGLANSRFGVVILSPNYPPKHWTVQELNGLFAREEGGQKVILPVWHNLKKAELLKEYPILADRLAVNTNDGIEKVAEKIINTIKKEVGTPDRQKSKPKHICNIPFQRNPFFTGRESLIEDLHAALKEKHSAALSQQAIYGLGGIGKTQTAVEYAYRYKKEYEHILWIASEKKADILTSFGEIATLLNLPVKDQQDQSVIVKGVINWMEDHENWLLIFDNADKPELLESFLPHGENGSILITSRESNFAKLHIAKRYKMEEMPEMEAVDLLFTRTNREINEPSEVERAKRLAEELGYLPLALEQAGAYISKNEVLFKDYLTAYQNEHLITLEKSKPDTGKYTKTVATTWRINFNEIKKKFTASADLLSFCAFVSPDDIPFELFIEGREEMGPNISKALANIENDPLALSDLLEPLTRFSLISKDMNSKTCSIHRLVQEVLKNSLNKDEQRQWAKRAVNTVNEAFPYIEFENWNQCDRLLSHAQVAYTLIDEWTIESDEAGRLLNQTAFYLKQRARYEEAKPLYQRALIIDEKALGPDHPDVAIVRNNLAELYRAQGRYEEAEPLYLRVMEIDAKTLGPDHPDVATSLNNLAELYRAQGRYEEAESLYLRSLVIREKALGPDHPYVATSLNNLALLYDNQGRYDEAEPLYQRALDIYEKALGPDHPYVATSLNNLANLYRAQGRYEEAEPLYQRSFAIVEKTLGPDHPYVATSLNNLALLYDNQGRYEEAEPLYQRSLEIREKALGPDHPDVAQSLNNLAVLYDNQGRYEEAEPLYQRSLVIREKALGPDHPDVATSLNNLALLYNYQGRYEEAEPLYQRALDIKEKTLGSDHPDTGITLHCQAYLHFNQKKYKESESLYKHTLRIYEKALGPDHPDTAIALKNYAGLLRKLNRNEEAAALEARTKLIEEKRAKKRSGE